MNAAKLIIDVSWGVIPGTPEGNKRFVWTSEQQDKLAGGNKKEAEQALSEWIRMHGEARELGASKENPAQHNWVKYEWMWL